MVTIWNRMKKLLSSQKEKTVQSRDITNLIVGDIVSIDEIDYTVDGIIVYNDSGWIWKEYKIKDGNHTYWLSVEEDDDLEVSFFYEITPFLKKPEDKITYEGIEYHMYEGSDAKVDSVQGKINLSVGTPLDYFEYADKKDQAYLSIEIWDGEIEMSVGKEIPMYLIEVYPQN